MAKKIGCVLLLLMLLWLWIKPQYELSENNHFQMGQTEIEKNNFQAPQATQPRKPISEEEQLNFERRYNELREVFPPFQFSEDWLVEMHTLELGSQHCNTLNFIGNQWAQLSAQQRKMVEQIESDCQKQLAPYLYLKQQGLDWKKFVRAESDEGDQLNQAFELLVREKDILLLLQWALEQKNPHIMSGLVHSNHLTLANVSHVLNSKHVLYNKQTLKIAVSYMACQMSSDFCFPDTAFMFEQCVSDEKHCGVGFNDWYLKHVSLGQQKDVALLVEWVTQ